MVNLSIDPKLIKEAKRRGINLSKLFEDQLLNKLEREEFDPKQTYGDAYGYMKKLGYFNHKKKKIRVGNRVYINTLRFLFDALRNREILKEIKNKDIDIEILNRLFDVEDVEDGDHELVE